MKKALTFAAIQFLNYSICTVSWRAVSQANYAASVAIDTLYSSVQFWVIRKIAKEDDETLPAWLGFTAGGALGTAIGIWASIWMLGK